MAKLLVDLGERSYNIHIGANLLDKAGEFIRLEHSPGQVLLVSNPLVFSLYGEKVTNSLTKQGYSVSVALMPDGEPHKNVKEAMKIIDQSVRIGLERSSLVLALGGGVVGDLAGFVAAIYQRGVRFIQIPTTLLAQVDSSVGGKVAVNHRYGKNLIGAFHQPGLVLADTATLRTLTDRDYLSGLGEVIKYSIIFDADFFDYLEQHYIQILKRDELVLQYVILRCCQLKSIIVARDELENDVRMSLNLGHTFGHALEKIGRYRDHTHGEAVVMGTIAASVLSRDLGMLSDEELLRITKLCQALHLPVIFPQYNTATVYRHMLNDKKVHSGKMRLVLPTSIGHYTIRGDVPRAAVLKAISAAQQIGV